jgi:DNA-binding NarL/FixJ family response regulator
MVKVITVEDSVIVAKRLQSLLEELDNVKFLGNATRISKAMELMSMHNPDVVILDINLDEDMPVANGINLLITLKAKHVDLKVIMLTNLVEDQYRNTCKAFGADYFFDKSKDMKRIPETLHLIFESGTKKQI